MYYVSLIVISLLYSRHLVCVRPIWCYFHSIGLKARPPLPSASRRDLFRPRTGYAFRQEG